MSVSDNPTFGGLIPIQEFCDFLKKEEIFPKTILDAGACDGRDSLVFRENFPNASIVAVEAVQENYDKWLLHLKNIEPYCQTIGQFSKRQKFFVKETNGISSLRNRGAEYSGFEREVDVLSLDDFCKKADLWPVDVLKIDVEGCTWDVLAGGRRTLRTVKALHIETETIEYFEGQKLDLSVNWVLAELGFKVIKAVSGPEIMNSEGQIGVQYESIWVRG